MPMYEYQCDACSGVFETIRKFSDPPLTQCRLCGAEGVRKLLSAPAFRLKGGGWYETDFKSGNQRNVVKGDSEGGSKSDGGKSDAGKSGESSGGAGSNSGSDAAKKKSESTGGSGAGKSAPAASTAKPTST